MGLLRGAPPCARAMARLGAVRSHYCALLLAAALAVCAFYYLGSGRETFSSATKRLKEARAGAPAAPSPLVPELAQGSVAPAPGAKAKSLEGGGAGPVDYHLLMMFTKAEHNAALQAKARVAIRSLLRLAKFEAHEVLNLHFVSEETSREVAKALLRELLPPAAGFKCKVVFHDVGVLTDRLFPVVEAMQKHFSAGSGTYYSDSIFFLSVAMHQIMPKERRAPLQHEEEGKGASQALYVQSFLHRDFMAGPWAAQLLESIHKFTVNSSFEVTQRYIDNLKFPEKIGWGNACGEDIERSNTVEEFGGIRSKSSANIAKILRIIQLDLDLKYKTNIRELFEEFDNFLPGAVIGIAREMQPVYRHTFWQFRHENPKTRVGGPPPEGLPGFNSGVMLLNLEAMRQSPLYGRLLEPAQVQQLANKYHFRGHLGDQDFFTMIGMEHPELFHVLDCTWNRQLCTWWRDHGYSDVFDAYFWCEGHVRIYHGNCNTPIPEA
ncbi:hypothetical protein EI555_008528 [Monodon monoceros]|uniref:Xyloside xylosyltransferase 1 n=1 Tax=Monodon monoceros TaxID=40151 RepID=A0A4U1F4E2_MONMO|nr:hypothetical protein EI555_008528 [Monodon monoceros]